MKKLKVKESIKGHTKAIVTLVAGVGVSELMGSVMRDYKPNAKGIHKAMIYLGAVALTGMVINAVNNYLEDEVDTMFEQAEKMAEIIANAEKKKEVSEDEHGTDTED